MNLLVGMESMKEAREGCTNCPGHSIGLFSRSSMHRLAGNIQNIYDVSTL